MPMSQPTARRTAARTASLTSLLCVSGPLLLASTQAQAIPSFARQTGSSCADCHVGSYGPSLTPYGMRFKLGGFTDTDGDGTKIPVSGQLTWSRNNPNRGDSTSRLREADLYLAAASATTSAAIRRSAPTTAAMRPSIRAWTMSICASSASRSRWPARTP